MKILFICGSLEMGKDGVGDYTRRLSQHLEQQGHQIILVAIHDRHLARPASPSFDPSFCTHRFSSSLTWSLRATHLETITDHHRPDWISVQFVPFSFHPKGLCYNWLWLQNQIAQKYPLHVMFHETWVGWDMPEKLTTRILGFLQLSLFTLFHFSGSSACTSTQLPLHQRRLHPHGFHAQLLPLFSNIGIARTDRTLVRSGLIASHYPDAPDHLRIAGFFGNLQGSFDPDLFVEWAQAHETEPWLILAAGQHDSASQRRWEEIVRRRLPCHQYAAIGSLSDHEVSYYMQALDLGFSAYPEELIGKSGAAAAMWEHGLTIVSTGRFNRRQQHFPRLLPNPVPLGQSTLVKVAHDLIEQLHASATERLGNII
jgi:hypothetical protein